MVLYPMFNDWLPDVLTLADVMARHNSFAAVQFMLPSADSVGEVEGGHFGA